jgi:hypothetical protein
LLSTSHKSERFSHVLRFLIIFLCLQKRGYEDSSFRLDRGTGNEQTNQDPLQAEAYIYYSRLLRSLHIFKSGTLFLMAAAYLVATLSLLFNPALRQMERSPNLENEPVTVAA